MLFKLLSHPLFDGGFHVIGDFLFGLVVLFIGGVDAIFKFESELLGLLLLLLCAFLSLHTEPLFLGFNKRHTYCIFSMNSCCFYFSFRRVCFFLKYSLRRD